MTQAIRFYSLNRDGSEKLDYGRVRMAEDGLEYDNELVREMMANTVHLFGEENAFRRFSKWTNGYGVCSHLVDDDGEEPVAAAAGRDVTPGHDELHHFWTRDPEGLAQMGK